MNVLIVINDGPYGTERAYNGLRLAMNLQKEHPDVRVRVFLMADAVHCALPGQSTPEGYYNVGRMLRSVVMKGGEVRACGTCAAARGIKDTELIEGVVVGKMSDLSMWVVDSERVVTF